MRVCIRAIREGELQLHRDLFLLPLAKEAPDRMMPWMSVKVSIMWNKLRFTLTKTEEDVAGSFLVLLGRIYLYRDTKLQQQALLTWGRPLIDTLQPFHGHLFYIHLQRITVFLPAACDIFLVKSFSQDFSILGFFFPRCAFQSSPSPFPSNNSCGTEDKSLTLPHHLFFPGWWRR